MNYHDVIMKHGRLVVFIRHDSAEIWWFKCRLKLNFIASTGVFVLVLSNTLLVDTEYNQARF